MGHSAADLGMRLWTSARHRSIEELKQLSDDCPDEIELHKPYIDQVHIRCSECGGR